MKTPTYTRTLSQIIDGYTLAAAARRLSPHTLADYTNTFHKFQAAFEGDPLFHLITPQHIQTFLASQPVSKKTLLNYHTGLSALWTWTVENNLAPTHLLRQIHRPKPEKRAIHPFTQADVKALLSALATSKPYRNHGVLCTNTLPDQERNRAILLTLLDTGIRAEELCTLTLPDFDPKNLQLRIFGKGSKERYIPISNRTASAIWRYLTTRPDPFPTDPLFTVASDQPMDRHRLLKQLRSIGKRAGIPDCHPHRFRHTFAINYLRNGGDIYTLQLALGHATLSMCKTYLELAQTDLQTAHRTASPVKNWGL